MVELQIDWVIELSSLASDAEPHDIGAAVLAACGRRYVATVAEHGLLEFEQHGAVYLFDEADMAGLPQEPRTVAAWCVTPPGVGERDTSYQRGFPLSPGPDGQQRDRGHLIPHLSGGEFGPNIFAQDRALNRGWSPEGKRYRGIEREAAATPGVFLFGHLLYGDASAYPSHVEIGVWREGHLRSELFDNQPGSALSNDGPPA